MTDSTRLLGISNAIVDVLAHIDDDFLDKIDQAFIDEQIDGIQVSLACVWLEMNRYSLDVAPVVMPRLHADPIDGP